MQIVLDPGFVEMSRKVMRSPEFDDQSWTEVEAGIMSQTITCFERAQRLGITFTLTAAEAFLMSPDDPNMLACCLNLYIEEVRLYATALSQFRKDGVPMSRLFLVGEGQVAIPGFDLWQSEFYVNPVGLNMASENWATIHGEAGAVASLLSSTDNSSLA